MIIELTGGNGGSGSGSGSGHSSSTVFSARQQGKKKRKSRTAFTNHQIFELEKRFLYQKYLSPADRDEIALTLGLTNAQVITWVRHRILSNYIGFISMLFLPYYVLSIQLFKLVDNYDRFL